MEIFLALAGITAVALLVQSRPLPSEADFKKAVDKLLKNQSDPDANTVVGKYLAFVDGDYKAAMPHLALSSDKTLKTLAVHELDPEYTEKALQKIGMGDEWVSAARSFPALMTIFLDRASQWYILAWPDLTDSLKMQSREQGRKMAASRILGARKGVPKGWKAEGGGAAQAVLDGSIAHMGSFSAKLPPRDPKTPNAEIILRSDFIPVTGNTLEVSAFVRSDGTEDKTDQFFVNYFDKDQSLIGVSGPRIEVDLPFWNRVYEKSKIPEKTAFVQVGGIKRSRSGNFWIDDASVKVDGKEVLKNPSFEDR